MKEKVSSQVVFISQGNKKEVLGSYAVLWKVQRLWKWAGLDLNPSFATSYVIRLGQLSDPLHFPTTKRVMTSNLNPSCEEQIYCKGPSSTATDPHRPSINNPHYQEHLYFFNLPHLKHSHTHTQTLQTFPEICPSNLTENLHIKQSLLKPPNHLPDWLWEG